MLNLQDCNCRDMACYLMSKIMHHADLVRNGSTPIILSQRAVAMLYSLFEQEQNGSDVFQILI